GRPRADGSRGARDQRGRPDRLRDPARLGAHPGHRADRHAARALRARAGRRPRRPRRPAVRARGRGEVPRAGRAGPGTEASRHRPRAGGEARNARHRGRPDGRADAGADAMSLPFPRSEYDERLRRTRAAMREAGLDVLLVFHQEHMFYLAGYDQIGYWVYQVLVVPAGDAPMTAIVRKVDELLVRDGGIVDDVRVWLDDATRDPAQQTADVLRERGLLDRRRIGIERKSHALLPYYHDLLREALRGAELVDASDLITELRLIKSPAEIACMRRAGPIMAAGERAA